MTQGDAVRPGRLRIGKGEKVGLQLLLERIDGGRISDVKRKGVPSLGRVHFESGFTNLLWWGVGNP